MQMKVTKKTITLMNTYGQSAKVDRETNHHVYANRVKYSEDDGYMRTETVWLEGE